MALTLCQKVLHKQNHCHGHYGIAKSKGLSSQSDLSLITTIYFTS